MDISLIDDALQLCLEARKSKNKQPNNGYCSIAREKGPDVIVYENPKTPFYLNSEGVISELFEHISVSEHGSERLPGYYAVRFNYDKLNAWVIRNLHEQKQNRFGYIYFSRDGKLIFFDEKGKEHFGTFSPYTNSYKLLTAVISKKPHEVIPFRNAWGFREQRTGGESTDEQRVRAAIKAIRNKLKIWKKAGIDMFDVRGGVSMAYPVTIVPDNDSIFPKN